MIDTLTYDADGRPCHFDSRRVFPFFNLAAESQVVEQRLAAIDELRRSSDPTERIAKSWDDRLECERGLVEEYLGTLHELMHIEQVLEMHRHELGWLEEEGRGSSRLRDLIEELENQSDDLRNYIKRWDRCEREREFRAAQRRWCTDRSRQRVRVRAVTQRQVHRVLRSGPRRSRSSHRIVRAVARPATTGDPDSSSSEPPGDRARLRAVLGAMIEAARSDVRRIGGVA